MRIGLSVFFVGLTVLGSPTRSLAASAAANALPTQPRVHYGATPYDVVKDMLWMADIGTNNVVYDLGSGDGRIVIAAVRDFGVRKAVGIEVDPQRIRESRQNAEQAGVADRVEFIQGDLFTSDFSQADVLTLYLGHGPNIDLRPKIFRMLKPGARVVSHQFAMGEWKPDKTLTVSKNLIGMVGITVHLWSLAFAANSHVPDYDGNEGGMHRGNMVKTWVVPASVAGIWRGKVATSQGVQELRLAFHQRLSEVNGSFHLLGDTNIDGRVSIELWGDHLRIECDPNGMPYGKFQIRFDGHVREDTLNGTLAVIESGQAHEHAWTAQRDPADFARTWEWWCPDGPRMVRLRIEQRSGLYTATYLDRDKAMPVLDFYDFGGGFYFTLPIGRESNSRTLSEYDGWLIGEAIVETRALNLHFSHFLW